MEKSKGTGWERSSNFIRQQSAEEVITKKSESDAQKRKAERNRAAKVQRDREKKILIIGIVGVVLVIILIFSLGKSWQRRVDKKEIDRLTKSNVELQAQIQTLQESNEELQDSLAAMETEPKAASDTTAEGGSSTHVLQSAYNFREEANTDSDVLAELDEGTTVTIVKELEDGWVEAKYNGQTGYIKCGDELTSSTGSITTTPSTAPASGEEEEA